MREWGPGQNPDDDEDTATGIPGWIIAAIAIVFFGWMAVWLTWMLS